MPSVIETNELLAQRLIPTTGDSVLLTVNDSATTYLIKTIIVCNTTAAAKTYSLYVNPGGNVSGDQFALCKTIPLAANASDQRIYPGDGAIVLGGVNCSLIAKASTANSVTVTVYGVTLETL